MDGHFVPNLTFGPALCAAIRPHVRTVMDVHLMIAPVDPYIEAFAKAGADIISAHAEAGPHIHRTLQAIRAHGCKAGRGAQSRDRDRGGRVPARPARPRLRDDGEPGVRRPEVHPLQLEKIRRLRAMIGDRPIHIEVDGGVTPQTAPQMVAAGADVLVAGSAVFNGGSVADPAPYGANIRAIREAAERAVAVS